MRHGVSNSLLDASATMTAYYSIERTAPDEGEPLLMNRRRRSSRTWTLVSAIVVLCLLGFGAIAVHQASVSEEEFSEGFDLAGLSTADETLERDDSGKFLSSYGEPDVDEETLSPPAELGWGWFKKVFNAAKKKAQAKKRAQAKKECPKLIKACKVKNGRQCASRCKAVWYMRYQYQASCKAYSCK